MRNYRYHNKYQASIALPTAVLIGSILLLGGLSVVLLGIDVKRATQTYNESTVAKMWTEPCIEEAIARVKFDPGFTGQFTISSTEGSCSALVSNLGENPGMKELIIESDNLGSLHEKRYKIDLSDNNITVSAL